MLTIPWYENHVEVLKLAKFLIEIEHIRDNGDVLYYLYNAKVYTEVYILYKKDIEGTIEKDIEGTIEKDIEGTIEKDIEGIKAV